MKTLVSLFMSLLAVSVQAGGPSPGKPQPPVAIEIVSSERMSDDSLRLRLNVHAQGKTDRITVRFRDAMIEGTHERVFEKPIGGHYPEFEIYLAPEAQQKPLAALVTVETENGRHYSGVVNVRLPQPEVGKQALQKPSADSATAENDDVKAMPATQTIKRRQ